MNPVVDTSPREEPKSTDDPNVVAPTQEIQAEKATRPSDDLPVKEPVEDSGGAQGSLLKDENFESDMKLESDTMSDPDDSFEPPPLPGIIPKGPLRPPVTGSTRPPPGKPRPR